MERKQIIKLRDSLEEVVDLLNEILTADYEKDEELLEQKTAMFLYKMLKIKNSFE